jgi:hypothetical protein
MRTERGRRAAWWIACGALVALGALGCGPGEAKAPNPTRALDERRALEIIRRAVKNEGVEPAAGRDEPIAGSGKVIHIDVGVAGKGYGIAYITAEDADALGDAIPPPNKKDEKLKLVRAGSDGETHVVLLYQQNYKYDDLAGEGHEQTTITIEGTLSRDVQDFITHARAQKYK